MTPQRAAYMKAYRERNREKILQQMRDRYQRNKEDAAEKARSYYLAHRPRLLRAARDYALANPETVAAMKSNWLKRNRERVNRRRSRRMATDHQMKLAVNLRCRLLQAIRSGARSGSAVRDLGCTIEEFKVHLEKLFLFGMSWDNWNREGWHIDHIKPLASFDLSDREQFLQATHFTNMQPLWAVDNLKKGASLVA